MCGALENRTVRVIGFARRGMKEDFIKKVAFELCLKDEQKFSGLEHKRRNF